MHLEQGDCFAWLSCWKAAPTHVAVGIQELYEQLLPTKVFYHRKVGTSGSGEERCRMCGKATESVPHILAGCGALAQTLYLARHNNALKILFFQVIRALDLQSASKLLRHSYPLESISSSAAQMAPSPAPPGQCCVFLFSTSLVDSGTTLIRVGEGGVSRKRTFWTSFLRKQ